MQQTLFIRIVVATATRITQIARSSLTCHGGEVFVPWNAILLKNGLAHIEQNENEI